MAYLKDNLKFMDEAENPKQLTESVSYKDLWKIF